MTQQKQTKKSLRLDARDNFCPAVVWRSGSAEQGSRGLTESMEETQRSAGQLWSDWGGIMALIAPQWPVLVWQGDGPARHVIEIAGEHIQISCQISEHQMLMKHMA